MQANNGSESQPSNNPQKDGGNNDDESTSDNKVVVAPPQAVTAAVQGQQWVAMQYPPAAAAMVMQHGMNRTIWVGDLHNWMDEQYLRTCFDSTGEEYIKSKTLSEKEILRYNNEKRSEREMEVVSLACGLVGGETLLSYLPSSLPVVLSQLTCDQIYLRQLRFSQELMGSIPVVHIEDVCDAHIFCIEKNSLKGRFLCAAESRTIEEIAICYQEIYPLCQIQEGFECKPRGGSKCDLSKLRKEGFEYKYELKETTVSNTPKDSGSCKI